MKTTKDVVEAARTTTTSLSKEGFNAMEIVMVLEVAKTMTAAFLANANSGVYEAAVRES